MNPTSSLPNPIANHLRSTSRTLADICAMYPQYTRWGTVRAKRCTKHKRLETPAVSSQDQQTTASIDAINDDDDDFYDDCPFLPSDSHALRTFKLVNRHVQRRRVFVLRGTSTEDVYYDAHGAYEYDWTGPEEEWARRGEVTAMERQCDDEVQDFEEYMASLGSWRTEPGLKAGFWRRWIS